MKIIIEETLIINFFIIFLIIRFTALLTKQKTKFIFLSSFYGSLISLAYPLFNIKSVFIYIVLFATLSLIILTSFKYLSFKKYLVDVGMLLISTFALGGACIALQNAVGNFPLFIVSVVCIVLYILGSMILKFIRRNNARGNFIYKLTLKDGENVVEEEAYLDSGNVLYDNLTNKPIILINFDVFQKFYKNISYFNARLKTIDSSSIKNGHYININSIGKGTNMLVFTIDELMINEKFYKNVSLGLSFSGFEKSFGKNVLLHCDFV